MLWIVPWLEIIGLLAVIFAFGIGLGFGGSALVRRLTRKAPRKAAAPAPIVEAARPAPVEPAPFMYPQTAVPPVETAPLPVAAAPAPEAEPEAEAEPALVAAPVPAAPQDTGFQTISHRAFVTAAYQPVTPFSATITRPTTP